MAMKILIALVQTINIIINLYFYLILIRCLMSWIPRLDIYKQPFAFICAVVDPYLDFFRKFIPPFGGIDFSPIVATVVLFYVIQRLLFIAINYIGELLT